MLVNLLSSIVFSDFFFFFLIIIGFNLVWIRRFRHFELLQAKERFSNILLLKLLKDRQELCRGNANRSRKKWIPAAMVVSKDGKITALWRGMVQSMSQTSGLVVHMMLGG
ncbi:hypothetical protein F0562_008216 [Nyssa sinensis]|uniref:Uncharacterized protein n=1 Tax=Nyssa sinensis TaxID=561372 RepID=A0A5J5AB68_9ASTE|nr:hypothetical protein F0562_008216 [Nyssa sinensis]